VRWEHESLGKIPRGRFTLRGGGDGMGSATCSGILAEPKNRGHGWFQVDIASRRL